MTCLRAAIGTNRGRVENRYVGRQPLRQPAALRKAQDIGGMRRDAADCLLQA